VSGSGISWATSLQTDNHDSTPPLSFYRPDALPAAQPTASKHCRHHIKIANAFNIKSHFIFTTKYKQKNAQRRAINERIGREKKNNKNTNVNNYKNNNHHHRRITAIIQANLR